MKMPSAAQIEVGVADAVGILQLASISVTTLEQIIPMIAQAIELLTGRSALSDADRASLQASLANETAQLDARAVEAAKP